MFLPGVCFNGSLLCTHSLPIIATKLRLLCACSVPGLVAEVATSWERRKRQNCSTAVSKNMLYYCTVAENGKNHSTVCDVEPVKDKLSMQREMKSTEDSDYTSTQPYT